ncbi:hypothetical protein PAAG_00491 [Paracoccidioides lutzii Pb01]|uniref:Uncharacterized protein n=1 Tax=Paracoccidioides lutzii (strain ATCC MYA-826 / Pb01) TaxID=502779 RepID=C1GPP6_PARBA|nr:hypothetical protein PAAG_00491 [Paracoccidioides lutzii Pb01]EEH36168.1 hypothetical protein PAAG_00491 [Paracoccidioides lutzii Pb01]
MLNSESKSSCASSTFRNLTSPQRGSTNRLPRLEPCIETTDGGTGPPITAPPTTPPTLRSSVKTKPHLRSEENSPLRSLTHRRAKTEVPSLPYPRTNRNGNETLSQLHHLSEDCLEEVELDPSEKNSRAFKSDIPRRLFTGLFQGVSSPIRFGLIPSFYPKEDDIENSQGPKETTLMAELFSSRPPGRVQYRMSMPSPLKQVSSTARLSLFGTKANDSKQGQLPEPAEDEFLNLDISSVLCPANSTDLPTAEALKTLPQNAEQVIRELHAAYKQRTFALHEALAEKSSLGEELEETHSRLQNIKTQLNRMAEKVLEQDKAIKAMADEFNLERQKQQQEEEARKRSVVLVQELEPVNQHIPSSVKDGQDTMSISCLSKRSSGGAFHSDSGFESGYESTTESIFSSRNDGLGSPMTVATKTSRSSSPDICPHTPLHFPSSAQLASPQLVSPSKLPTSAPAPKSSTYDKILKGISSAGFGGSLMSSGPFSVSRCSNCYGANASDAWAIASILKEENGGLKNRIWEMEAVIDECITLVGG